MRIRACRRPFRFAENTLMAKRQRDCRVRCSLPLPTACGMIAATEIKAAKQCGMSTGRFQMKRVLSGVLATLLAVSASAALAQSKPPLKLGGILDMSGLYAHITGPGSGAAPKIAPEDFGGQGLG